MDFCYHSQLFTVLFSVGRHIPRTYPSPTYHYATAASPPTPADCPVPQGHDDNSHLGQDLRRPVDISSYATASYHTQCIPPTLMITPYRQQAIGREVSCFIRLPQLTEITGSR